MKKALSILAVVAGLMLALGIVSKHAQATRMIFQTGSADELETAKRISFEILRERTAARAVRRSDDYGVKRIEIDDLRMAHTHVQQVIDGVPVWGGEAIVHLNADGTLFTITDDLLDSVAVSTKPNYSESEAIMFGATNVLGFATPDRSARCRPVDLPSRRP